MNNPRIIEREGDSNANWEYKVEHPNNNRYRNQWTYYANYIRRDNVRRVGDRYNRVSKYRRNSNERRPYRNNENGGCHSPSPSREVNQEWENRQERATMNDHTEN